MTGLFGSCNYEPYSNHTKKQYHDTLARNTERRKLIHNKLVNGRGKGRTHLRFK